MNEELQTRIATALASDTGLYNEIVQSFTTMQDTISSHDGEKAKSAAEIERLQTANNQYLSQIGNLVSKIPITKTENAQQTFEQKLAGIISDDWTTPTKKEHKKWD